jgi:hypothetical protein
MSNAGADRIPGAPILVSNDLIRDAPVNYSAVQALELMRRFGAHRALQACRFSIEQAFPGFRPAVPRKVRRPCR